MAKFKLKPVAIQPKSGLFITFIVLAGTIIGGIIKWHEAVLKNIAPNGNLLNWVFVSIAVALSVLTTWFIMNQLWSDAHKTSEERASQLKITEADYEQKIKGITDRYELEILNLKEMLRNSQIEHSIDPITGVPNIRGLLKDFEQFFLSEVRPSSQLIFIDLKNFGEINKNFLSQKTNKLLRYIAKDIYMGMRRNENMFKFPSREKKRENRKEGFYRIYPGGDEFVFIIQGDQSDALGFVNRLRKKFKTTFTDKTEKILGSKKELSFYCSVVEIDERDKSFKDIYTRAELGYRTVWTTASGPFAITWFPETREKRLSKDKLKASIYAETKESFEVISMGEPDLFTSPPAP